MGREEGVNEKEEEKKKGYMGGKEGNRRSRWKGKGGGGGRRTVALPHCTLVKATPTLAGVAVGAMVNLPGHRPTVTVRPPAVIPSAAPKITSLR